MFTETARGGLHAIRGSGQVRSAFLVAFLVGCSSESWDRLWGYHLIEHIGVPAWMDEVLLFGAIGLLAQAGGFFVVRAVRGATADVSRASMASVLALFYLGIAVALESVPVLLVAGLRWMFAGVILSAFMLLSGRGLPGLDDHRCRFAATPGTPGGPGIRVGWREIGNWQESMAAHSARTERR